MLAFSNECRLWKETGGREWEEKGHWLWALRKHTRGEESWVWGMNLAPFTQATLLLTPQTLVWRANLWPLACSQTGCPTSAWRAPLHSRVSGVLKESIGRNGCRTQMLRNAIVISAYTEDCIRELISGPLILIVCTLPITDSSPFTSRSDIFHRSVPRELAQFHAEINEHFSYVFSMQWN